VSGHTHLAYNHSVPVPAWEGRAVTERPVVSAGQYGQNLNQLLFTVNDATGQVTAKTQNLIALTKDADGPTGPALFQPEFPADPATTTIVSEAFAAAEGPGSVVLGQLAAPFKRATLANGTTENRGGESTLSNLVAEVQRWATAAPESGGAQIALMNAGGLRQNMLGNNAGGYPANLTYKQAAVVQPFANTLVNMRLTGAQLKAVLEQQWQRDAGGAVPTRPFQRLGTSAGFRYTYDPARPEGDRITGMWLNGTALDKATAYSVTVNSFLASGGDNFRALRDGTSRRDTGKVDLQAMVDYLAAKSPVSPDYTQHAVGVSFPAGAPAGYLPGERVKFNLSSLAFTAPEDAKDPSVTVSLGGTNLGTFPVDNTLGTDQFDEYGKAAIDVAIPAGATAGARELVVTGTTTGTVVTVPVTVRAVAVPPTPPTTGLVETRIGRVVHKPQRVVAGETRARIKFRVKATSGTPDGRVRVRVNGKVYKVRLEDGRVKIKLTKFAKPGRYKVTIKYLGTDVFESAKKVVTLRVRRS
jgi:5'-nucleotidase